MREEQTLPEMPEPDYAVSGSGWGPMKVAYTEYEYAVRAYGLACFNAGIAEGGALAERLKMEAQIHAQEARTANATIAEIYQLISGATGEPGNWNGAEPVRKFIETLRAEGGKDAERYRFLRDAADPDDEQPHCVISKTNDWGKSYDEWATGSALDETIDAAMTPPAAMPNKDQK